MSEIPEENLALDFDSDAEIQAYKSGWFEGQADMRRSIHQRAAGTGGIPAASDILGLVDAEVMDEPPAQPDNPKQSIVEQVSGVYQRDAAEQQATRDVAREFLSANRAVLFEEVRQTFSCEQCNNDGSQACEVADFVVAWLEAVAEKKNTRAAGRETN